MFKRDFGPRMDENFENLFIGFYVSFRLNQKIYLNWVKATLNEGYRFT
jgi:hypothetical protein